MSEFLKNTTYVHIATEVLYACMMTYFVYTRNKQLSLRIQLLEEKLLQYEQVLQHHEQLIQKVLNGPVGTVEAPAKVLKESKTKPKPKPNVLSPPKQQNILFYQSAPVVKPVHELSPAVVEEVVEEEVEEVVEEEVEEETGDEIETQGGYEENLDEEIQRELNKLKLLKED